MMPLAVRKPVVRQMLFMSTLLFFFLIFQLLDTADGKMIAADGTLPQLSAAQSAVMNNNEKASSFAISYKGTSVVVALYESNPMLSLDVRILSKFPTFLASLVGRRADCLAIRRFLLRKAIEHTDNAGLAIHAAALALILADHVQERSRYSYRRQLAYNAILVDGNSINELSSIYKIDASTNFYACKAVCIGMMTSTIDLWMKQRGSYLVNEMLRDEKRYQTKSQQIDEHDKTLGEANEEVHPESQSSYESDHTFKNESAFTINVADMPVTVEEEIPLNDADAAARLGGMSSHERATQLDLQKCMNLVWKCLNETMGYARLANYTVELGVSCDGKLHGPYIVPADVLHELKYSYSLETADKNSFATSRAPQSLDRGVLSVQPPGQNADGMESVEGDVRSIGEIDCLEYKRSEADSSGSCPDGRTCGNDTKSSIISTVEMGELSTSNVTMGSASCNDSNISSNTTLSSSHDTDIRKPHTDTVGDKQHYAETAFQTPLWNWWRRINTGRSNDNTLVRRRN